MKNFKHGGVAAGRLRIPVLLGFAVFALVCESPLTVRAAVTAQEAAQLKTTLTPLGAERQGNKDGTIPAWTGGYTTVPQTYPAGQPRPDPFSTEKPLFSITAANAASYAGKLPEGARQLFSKYSDYRMDIYPAHRSAAFPQAVYDNTFRNATRAHAAASGIAYGVEGAIGGIPFPIPKSGHEAVWNHLLAYWGPAREMHLSTYVASPNGTIELASGYNEITDFPYYYANATPDSLNGYYFKTKHVENAPPANAGQAYLAWEPIDTAKYPVAAWSLLPGQHRVRRAPALAYDIPDPEASGYQNLDEYYMFYGGPDRYDFKLIGKKEIYIPYNNNRFYMQTAQEVMRPKHANPDSLRYELHRVWVVEGTLAPRKHHIAPRRRLYLDEDTWLAVYSESWDESGKLWKFGQAVPYLMPDVPAVILGSQFIYDFVLGGYVYGFAFNGTPYQITAQHPASAFSPDMLAAQSIR